jgi:hypothetical protein
VTEILRSFYAGQTDTGAALDGLRRCCDEALPPSAAET